ncbi:MAG: hypothetical protein NT062_28345 [Proteobacteria bacterium]|nr:hypothetical protein [Pseudomonadota bacterium]
MIVGLCGLVVACAPPRAPRRDANLGLAEQLVGWDLARRHAEARLLTVPLPSVAIVGEIGSGGGDGVVVVPRLSPHFAAVFVAWPTICERRGVLADDVFAYAMAWCRHVRDGRGDLEQALAGFLDSPVPGLRVAALDDLVNVVADAHAAATAMRILASFTPLHASPGTLVKLAAIYDVLGRDADAAEVRAQLPPVVRSPGCTELTAALATFAPRSLITIQEVAAGTTSCGVRARALVCRVAAASNDVLDDPTCAATDELSATVRAGCDPDTLALVRARAGQLLRTPDHEARWTPTLQALATITSKVCAGLRTAGRP